MAGFQAVDLDSILDEFEFKQNEAENEAQLEIARATCEQDGVMPKLQSASEASSDSVICTVLYIMPCNIFN